MLCCLLHLLRPCRLIKFDADDIFVRVTGVVLPGAVDGNLEPCSRVRRPRPDERRVAAWDLTSARVEVRTTAGSTPTTDRSRGCR